MKICTRLLLVILAIGIGSGIAQEKPQPKGKPAAKSAQKPTAPAMEMVAKPAPEMQKLIKTLAGTWNAAEKHEAMEGMPAGTSTGTTVFRPGPGRLSLIQDYKSHMAGVGAFTGLGLVWWDPDKKMFTSMWCDSMTPSGCAVGGTGKWEGNDLVFTGEMEINGQKHPTKETFTNIKPDSVTFNVEMDGKPSMSIVYTKPAKK